jgi:FMN-dependent NADH-azoreductase
MPLFRLNASIRGEQSASRKLADAAEQAWRELHPGGTVIHRDLAQTPVPASAWQAAVAGNFAAEDQRDEDQRQAMRLTAELADELVAADAYLLALPLYNWGVSQHVKAWIDLLMNDPRLALTGPRPIAGRPASLIVTRGGGYGEGTPRHGWDHATPYYRRIFGDVLGLDLHVNEVELTLAEVNPAMEAFREQARELFQAGLMLAGEHGRLLAKQTAG